MTPPLKPEQEEFLNDLYYKRKMMFGRDRLFQYIRLNHPELKISRRQVLAWLKKQEINQLFKPAKKVKKISPTILKRPYDQIAVDLVDMQRMEYDGYNYILTCIDMFSKKAWVEPLKGKSGKVVSQGMNEILDDIKHPVKTIRSDNGSEFNSKPFKDILKKHNVKQIFSSAYTPQSNGMIERLNGTIKKLIHMFSKATDRNDWVDYLQELVDNYNNTYHRVIKSSPNKIIEEQKNKKFNVIDNLKTEKNIRKAVEPKNDTVDKIRFKKGDIVRLKLKKDKENVKSYDGYWGKELFKISHVFKPKGFKPPYYYVKGLNNEKQYSEKLYNNDLQKVEEVEHKIEEPERFEISKILDKKTINRKVNYLVKWKEHKTPEWVLRTDLIKDVPKVIKAYENNNKK